MIHAFSDAGNDRGIQNLRLKYLAITALYLGSLLALPTTGYARGTAEGVRAPEEMVFPDSMLRYESFEDYVELYVPDGECLCYASSGFIQAAGYEIFTSVFRGNSRSKPGSVWIAHGYLHRQGYYLSLAARLRDLGWDVVLFDLPGHGLSSGPRAEIPSFWRYGELINDLINSPHLEGIGSKKIALGHSTGASAYISQALSYGTAFDSYIFLAPLIRSAAWNLSRTSIDIRPARMSTIPRLIRKSSGDDEFMRFMRREDLFTHRRIPVAWIDALIRWNSELENLPRESWTQAFSGTAVTLIQGGRDTVVDWRYNLPFLSHRIPNNDVYLIEQARHDLLFESEGLRMQGYSRLFDALFAQNDSKEY